MHNPTRRMKRLKRSLPLNEPRKHWQLPETSDTLFNVAGEPNHASSSSYVRHRQGTQPDALRGAMLVALIVVTIVLYLLLWELERSSFVSVPRPNLNQSIVAASSSNGNSEAAATRYPSATVNWQDGPVSASGKEPNESGDAFVVPLSKASCPTSNSWPPPVTRVPEEHDATEDLTEQNGDHHKDETTKLSSFDAAYSNGACRFLLPVRVGEQESKARVHFMQLLVLAQRLNRTIVLPHVGESRLSACSEWPFGAYYDTNGLAHTSDAPDTRMATDLEWLAKWLGERPVPPNSFVVSMKSIHQDRRDFPGSKGNSEDVPFLVEKAKVQSKVLSCLGFKLARIRSSLPETALSISFDSSSHKTKPDASIHLVQLLSSSLDLDTDSDFGLDWTMEPGYEYTSRRTNSSNVSLADIDVLILDYDLRYPLFAASALSNFNLHYAPMLYDLADRLSDNLGPFLGIHWRMENVPVQNLAWCAASLVSTLHALLQDDVTGKDVRHIWLATDHPHPLSSFMDDRMLDAIESGKDGGSVRKCGPLRKSSTFKALSVEHDDALWILAEAFQSGGDLEAWELTDLAEQLRRYPYVEGRFDVNSTLLGDSGVFGILDKLVIVQARVFVSGSSDCSKTSSFTKQVIEARQESFKAERGTEAIRNVVEYFGKW